MLSVLSCKKEIFETPNQNKNEINSPFFQEGLWNLQSIVFLAWNKKNLKENVSFRSDAEAFQISGEIKSPVSGEKLYLNFHLFPTEGYKEKLKRRIEKADWEKIKEEYDGIIIAYEINSDLKQFAAVYRKGEFVSSLFTREEATALLYPIGCVEHTYTVTTYHYTDWYVNGTYVGTSYNGSTVETYSYVICDGSNGNDFNSGGGGGSTSITTIDYLGETEIIEDLASTDCVKEMISRIKGGDFGGNVFIQLIRDLFDSNENVNIEISESVLAAGTDGFFRGQRVGHSDFYVYTGELVLNILYTPTASQDWILATIIHEMVHGYINFCEAQVAMGIITQEELGANQIVV